MLARWKFDKIADHIESQFQMAAPTPRTLRRFFRQGIRHGKRGVALSHMRDFIVDVVELASERIAVRHLDEKHRIERELESLRTQQEMQQEVLAKLTQEAATDEASNSAPTGSALSQDGKGPDLVAALDQLKTSRHLQEEGARRAQREGQLSGIRRSLEEMAVAIAVAERHLEQLPHELRQMVSACQETGEVMWTRYRLGYLRGSARRGAAEAPTDSPEVEIEFANPSVMEVS